MAILHLQQKSYCTFCGWIVSFSTVSRVMVQLVDRSSTADGSQQQHFTSQVCWMPRLHLGEIDDRFLTSYNPSMTGYNPTKYTINITKVSYMPQDTTQWRAYQDVRKTVHICIHTKRRGIHVYLVSHTALPRFQNLWQPVNTIQNKIQSQDITGNYSRSVIQYCISSQNIVTAMQSIVCQGKTHIL